MQRFEAHRYPVPVRPDLPAAYREAWKIIASPGNWWTAEERIAIAQEARTAFDCALCASRKAALSPSMSAHRHPGNNVLSAAAVDTVHRICTDASRLTQTWLDDLAEEGISHGHYIELLGITVALISIDTFHKALGAEWEALPEPEPGAPTRYRPPGAKAHGAWIDTVAPADVSAAEADLYGGASQTGNVLSAMSLVPSSVMLLNILGQAQYLAARDVPNPATNGGRAIDRMQIELLAGRVSSINECFY